MTMYSGCAPELCQNNLFPGLFLSQDFLDIYKNTDKITVYSRTGKSFSNVTGIVGVDMNDS
jgi:hypothetical protein